MFSGFTASTRPVTFSSPGPCAGGRSGILFRLAALSRRPRGLCDGPSLGLVPRQSSTGGKERLGRISKMGDRYIRTLLVVGATAVLRHARKDGTALKGWARAVLERKPFRVAAVALANKLARIAWAVMTRGEPFRSIRMQSI